MRRIEAPLNRMGREWPVPRDVNIQFEHQLAQRLRLGFHEVLGRSAGDYALSFQDALADAKQHELRPGAVVFVEPRISIREQARLLEVDIAPSVWSLPEVADRKPYATWLRIIPNPGIAPVRFAYDVASYSSVDHKDLGAVTQLASPFEGLAADIDTLLLHSFVYLAGTPGIINGQRLLTLDTWMGLPRIAGANLNKIEQLTGALAATRTRGEI